MTVKLGINGAGGPGTVVMLEGIDITGSVIDISYKVEARGPTLVQLTLSVEMVNVDHEAIKGLKIIRDELTEAQLDDP